MAYLVSGVNRRGLRGIAGAQMVMLEGTGHMMFIERPDAFREAVAGFLAAA